jgi:hypothetical protein
MRRLRRQGRTLVGLSGGLIGGLALAVVGGQLLGGFTIGAVNPFYFEQRSRGLGVVPRQVGVSDVDSRLLSDYAAPRVHPEWIVYPEVPSTRVEPLAIARWEEPPPDPEPDLSFDPAPEPVAMIPSPQAAHVEEADVAAAGDTARLPEEHAPAAQPEPLAEGNLTATI